MGWALANVWYDKYDGPPPQKSPLESLFMLVALRRMEADLLSTRALVHASMGPDSNVDPTVKAFKDYADRVMPFLAGAQDLDRQKEREALMRMLNTKIKVSKKTVYAQQAARLRQNLGADKFKLKPRMPGV